MKCTINRVALARAAKVASQVCSRATQDAWKMCHLLPGEDGIQISAFDGEIHLCDQIRCEGEVENVAVPADKLSRALWSLAGDTVSLSIVKNCLRLKSGGNKYDIGLENHPTDIIVKTTGHRTTLPPGLSDILSRALNYTNPMDARLALGGVRLAFKDGCAEFVSSDSTSLTYRAVPVDGFPITDDFWVIPQKAASIVASASKDAGDVELVASENTLLFTIDSMEICTPVLTGRFPDMTHIRESGPTGKVGPQEFTAAIASVLAIAPNETHAIQFNFEADGVMLRSPNAEFFCPGEFDFTGRHYYQAGMLTAWLSKCPKGQEVSLSLGMKDSLVISESDQSWCCIFPIREPEGANQW